MCSCSSGASDEKQSGVESGRGERMREKWETETRRGRVSSYISVSKSESGKRPQALRRPIERSREYRS
eukprot:scaffold6181_cov129-Isochrysis_galbana.AAC.6